MKKNGFIAGLAATLLIASCFHEIHELGLLKDGEGLLGTSLEWEMPDDASTPIHSLSLSIGGAARPFTQYYKDAKEAAGELIPVAAGKNDVLATVNLSEADGFVIEGLPATKADVAVGEVVVSLKNPASSPAQAWFAVTDAQVREREITLVKPALQRLLSSLSVNITQVPAGTKLILTMSNVAKSVNLTAKDADGRYGLPGEESVGDVQIASLTAASDGPLGVENFMLLPTASAFQRCILTLDITSALGNKARCVCDAPHTESGKTYSLELDYTKLQPYMYLDTYSINPWEDGWTLNGEILDPQE